MRKAVAVLGAGMLVAVVSCGRNQTDYEGVANNALDQAQLADVDANYDSDAKVIHVTGTVTSEADRQRAGDVVQQAFNDGTQVANEVTVKGGNAETADDFDSAIEKRLSNMVELDSSLKAASIDFDANNGVLTITGQVPDMATKEHVAEMARSEPGVRDVINSLEVASGG